MSTTPGPLPRSVQLPAGVRTGLIFALLLLAAVAWAVTGERMGGGQAPVGTVALFATGYLVPWTVVGLLG